MLRSWVSIFKDVDELSLHLRIGGIHEAADTLANQTKTGEEDVDGNQNRKYWIPGQPACPQREAQSDQDADTGPAIG